MIDEQGVQIEKDGRVRIERGPVSVVLSASLNGLPAPKACLAALPFVDPALGTLARERALLSLAWPELAADASLSLSNLGKSMYHAAKSTGHPQMTSFCAVAGALADILADAVLAALAPAPSDTALVTVNNGGDIALRFFGPTTAKVGLVPALTAPGYNQIVEIGAKDGIFGIATSGFGGRGLTQGAADALTAFAPTAALADALATRLANACVPSSPKIHSALAGTIKPDSDIAHLPVTVAVEPLSASEIQAAFTALAAAALPLLQSCSLLSLRASLQGEMFWLGPLQGRALPANPNSGGPSWL